MEQTPVVVRYTRDDPNQGKDTVMSSTFTEGSALTAADRCDRCGAQAYLRVTMASGAELLFCAHHGRAHQNKLRQVALNIHDETDKID